MKEGTPLANILDELDSFSSVLGQIQPIVYMPFDAADQQANIPSDIRDLVQHHSRLLAALIGDFPFDHKPVGRARELSLKLCENPFALSTLPGLIHCFCEEIQWEVNRQQKTPRIAVVDGKEVAPVFMRRMNAEDRQNVLALKRSSFKFAESPDSFAECMADRREQSEDSRTNVDVKVGENNGNILGFLSYELERIETDKGHTYVVHISNAFVDDRFMQVGVPESLLSTLNSHLADFHSSICIDVDENNLRALNMLKKMGFRAVRVMRDSVGSSGNLRDQFHLVLTRRQFELLHGLE